MARRTQIEAAVAVVLGATKRTGLQATADYPAVDKDVAVDKHGPRSSIKVQKIKTARKPRSLGSRRPLPRENKRIQKKYTGSPERG